MFSVRKRRIAARAAELPMYDRIIGRFIPFVEFHQNRYARELGKACPAGCRWLDMGAGTRIHEGWLGPSQGELAARAGFVYGCDLVPGHLASNPYLDAAVAADARHLPFAGDRFDLVTANMVVEHLSDPIPVFREVARVLAPGGRLLLVAPNRRHPVVWVLSVVGPRKLRRRLAHTMEDRAMEHVFPTYYRANTVARLRRIARIAGLAVEHTTVFPSYPIFRRPWPLTLLEALWIRSLRWRPLRGLGSNLLCRMTRPAAPPRLTAETRNRRTSAAVSQ